MVKSSSKIQTLTLSLVIKRRYYVMFDFGGVVVMVAVGAPSITPLTGWPTCRPITMVKTI